MNGIRRVIEIPVITPEASKRFEEREKELEAKTRAILPPEVQKELAERDEVTESTAHLRNDLGDNAGW